ncbi:hypothetical protein EMIT0158MI4_260022 [Burkholderia ambifaria]
MRRATRRATSVLIGQLSLHTSIWLQPIHPAKMLVPVTAPKSRPTHCGPIAQHILVQIASEIPPLVTMMSGRKIFRTPSPSLTPIYPSHAPPNQRKRNLRAGWLGC